MSLGTKLTKNRLFFKCSLDLGKSEKGLKLCAIIVTPFTERTGAQRDPETCLESHISQYEAERELNSDRPALELIPSPPGLTASQVGGAKPAQPPHRPVAFGNSGVAESKDGG